MTTYAQTNLQLFNQLRQAGYSNADIGFLRVAYDLAMQLFTGLFRGSGKTFLAHLVGTASILTSQHAPIAVVTAGLLHAAYSHGQFGPRRRGISDAKREHVRRAIGYEVEELVARYSTFWWDEQTIRMTRESLDSISSQDGKVLLVRLANELEDHLDLGILYCNDAARHRDYIESCLYMCVEMAERLGYPDLASALKQAFDAVVSDEVIPALSTRQKESFVLDPPSYFHWLVVRCHYLFAHRFHGPPL